jgi:hypothetical protein
MDERTPSTLASRAALRILDMAAVDERMRWREQERAQLAKIGKTPETATIDERLLAAARVFAEDEAITENEALDALTKAAALIRPTREQDPVIAMLFRKAAGAETCNAPARPADVN